MDPLTERPHHDRDVDEPVPDVGLVELVDRALVRLDGLRDRPRLSSAVTALLVVTLAAGWGLTRWRAVEPFDERLPRVDDLMSADVAPVDPGGDGGGLRPGESGSNGAPEPATSPSTSEGVPSPTEADVRLVVHVSGAVVTEGLVELDAGSRLADAVAAAGGATRTADVHRLNLAMPLLDGMHIRVPELGEDGSATERPLVETAETGAAPGRTGAGAVGVEGTPVNVNSADREELQRLPGIGPALAGAIVTWRDDNGPFRSVDDLLDVPGIGPVKLAAIEDQVAV